MWIRRAFAVSVGWTIVLLAAPVAAQQKPQCTVPRDRLVFSTPPGAIPELNFPKMIPGIQATYLDSRDRVLGYVHNGVAKAYPYRIFWWHEVINDSIGGQFITVTYCPLTNTGILFLSTVGGKRFTFLTSGLLYNNNLVLTANEDDGLWPQMCPTDIQLDSDRTLTQLPVVDTTWDLWQRMYPNTLVTSSETGFDRDYTLYPYGDYQTNNDFLLFPLDPDDRRLPRKLIVFGVSDGQRARAYPYNRFSLSQAMNDHLGGKPIVVLLAKETESGAAFSRRVRGQELTFDTVRRADMLPLAMRDRETGTLWNFHGQAVEGPLVGEQLEGLYTSNAFWFAWAAFWVGTEIASPSTGVDDEAGDEVPRSFRLVGSYPNPVSVGQARQNGVHVTFELLSTSKTTLSLYNLLGRQVRILVDAVLAPDEYTLRWDGRDSAGQVVPPGMYFSVLSVADQREVRRLVLVP